MTKNTTTKGTKNTGTKNNTKKGEETMKKPATTTTPETTTPVTPKNGLKGEQKVTVVKGENPVTDKLAKEQRKLAKANEIKSLMETIKQEKLNMARAKLEVKDASGNVTTPAESHEMWPMFLEQLTEKFLKNLASARYQELHKKVKGTGKRGGPKKTPEAVLTYKIATLVHAAIAAGMAKDVIGNCIKEGFANPRPKRAKKSKGTDAGNTTTETPKETEAGA